MFFLVVIGLVFAICVLFELNKWYLSRTKLKAYGSLKEYPILGIGGRFIGKNNEEVLHTLRDIFFEANKLPFYAWLGPTLVMGIDDPTDMQTLLTADETMQKPYMYKFLYSPTGLLSADMSIWKQHRRALNPTFSTKVISGFVPIFNEKVNILVNQLQPHIERSFDMHRFLAKALMDAILNTSLGMNWQMQTKRGDEIYEIYMELIDILQRRLTRFWLRWDFIYNFTSDSKRERILLDEGFRFLNSVREVKAIELAEQLQRGEDFLQTKASNSLTWIEKCFLMFRNGSFTEQNLLDEINLLFLAGTDTTSVTLLGTLIMLAIHQECQEKVVAELKSIFEDAERPVTVEDLSRMTYMEMVIKEGMRHFPTGPFFARECTHDFSFKGGVIPKDTLLVFNIIKMHKNPKYWGERVDQFYPEHFSPENYSKMHPCSLMSFSYGPRNCIGMKYAWLAAKITLAHLLRRYKFTTHLKQEDIRTKFSIVLKIINKNPLRIEQRQF